MQRSPPDSERLHDRLCALLGTPRRIEPIESGTSGESFRVETKDGVFAAKLFYEHAEALLGPTAQFRLLEALAPADIAPKPVAADDHAGLLVTEWIHDGRAATRAELVAPDCIRAVAAVLAALHSVSADIPDFRPREYAAQYVGALGGVDCLGRSDRARHAELLELAAALEAGPEPHRLCHNDLTADNCFIGERCRLIDFDFAVSAPPILDLASLAEMNHFDEIASRRLLDAYFGDHAAHAPDFAGARKLVSLLAHFWALASADAGAAIVAQYRIKDD